MSDEVSGFALGSIRWRIDGSGYAAVSFSSENLIYKTINAGSFGVTEASTISRFSGEQVAPITYLYLVDTDGNSKYYDPDDLEELGFNLEDLALILERKNSAPTNLVSRWTNKTLPRTCLLAPWWPTYPLPIRTSRTGIPSP